MIAAKKNVNKEQAIMLSLVEISLKCFWGYFFSPSQVYQLHGQNYIA